MFLRTRMLLANNMLLISLLLSRCSRPKERTLFMVYTFVVIEQRTYLCPKWTMNPVTIGPIIFPFELIFLAMQKFNQPAQFIYDLISTLS